MRMFSSIPIGQSLFSCAFSHNATRTRVEIRPTLLYLKINADFKSKRLSPVFSFDRENPVIMTIDDASRDEVEFFFETLNKKGTSIGPVYRPNENVDANLNPFGIKKDYLAVYPPDTSCDELYYLSLINFHRHRRHPTYIPSRVDIGQLGLNVNAATFRFESDLVMHQLNHWCEANELKHPVPGSFLHSNNPAPMAK